MSDAQPSFVQRWQERVAAYKEELLQGALLGVPLAGIAKVSDALGARLFDQPWQAIWFLIPIALGAWLLWQGALLRDRLRPRVRLLAFLGVYLLAFSVATQASFLDLQRELTAFGAPASRRLLAPVAWGDWRYRLAPRKPDLREELIVVLLQPAQGRAIIDSRKELADLVALASRHDARGVALDVYFDRSSPVDRLLCHTIAGARMPVLVGYGFERSAGVIAERGVPESLRACITPERQVHLAGFLDFDRRSRLIPLFFRNDAARPALGLAVARALAGEASLPLPRDGLLRYIPPPVDPPVVRLDQLLREPGVRNLLRNRFVMAGEDSDRDSFETPFGRRRGILIHAYAAHSLRQAHYFERHSWWLGFALTFVLCTWMTLRYAEGARPGRLLRLCGALTLLIVVVAVASVVAGPYWFDLVYPLLAIWLLVPVLLLPGGITRRAHRHTPAARSVPPAALL